jgi:phosphoribosyl-AMP cyclohydrolase
VLLKVDQSGPACHTGAHSCFDDDVLLAGDGPVEDRG